jgi:two-component system sensor histidine kinase/response regulator
VDDNAANRLILAETLEHWQMRPVTADSGDAALNALERARRAADPFVVIVLDVQLPGMDGFTLAEHIRARPDAAAAKLLMLTSAGAPGDAARSKQLGVAAYLTKPVKQADLRRALLSALGAAVIAAPIEPLSASAPGRPLRILLAEDNPMNQKLAARLLEKHGHTVVVAANGREAIEAVERSTFDLVLMDVQMPEMDGFQATAILRERERATGRHLPIIAMTAYAMTGDRERCLEAGMDGYVSKPVRPDELYAVIAGLSPSAAVSSPNGQANGTRDVVDWNAALLNVGRDADLLRELIDVFRNECPRWLADLRDGLSRGEPERVKAAAHPLKGSLATFAARPACDAARKLETMGRDGRLTDGPQTLKQLEHELDRLWPILDAYVKNGQ